MRQQTMQLPPAQISPVIGGRLHFPAENTLKGNNMKLICEKIKKNTCFFLFSHILYMQNAQWAQKSNITTGENKL